MECHKALSLTVSLFLGYIKDPRKTADSLHV